MKHILTFFIVLLSANILYPQEQLRNLYGNPQLENIEYKKSIKINRSTTLPFFDDFSGTNIYPDAQNWDNNYVFINNNYGRGPVTIGVATFDAVDQHGNHYQNASASPYVADTLTSRVIDLSDADKNTLYFSFYYQPQGNGEKPEKNDSLVLQFFTADSLWQTVWFANGDNFNNFRLNTLGLAADNYKDTIEFAYVVFGVKNSQYFHNNFRFRFFNYASLNTIADPSDATNGDHWNIDYVYLAQGRDSSNWMHNDVTMIEAPNSFINLYSSVPWPHYNANGNARFRDIYLHMRNNSGVVRTLNQITLYFTDTQTGKTDSLDLGNLENIAPRANNRDKSRSFTDSPITWDNRKSASFIMKTTFFTDNIDITQNNSAVRYLNFDNYYSYDDGTAENSYGINSADAMVAYKFTTYKPDSLTAVSFYFLRNNPQTTAADGYKLCVWADNNGKPGKLIVEREGKNIEFADKLNTFVTIPLDTSVYVTDVFYVGWEQTSALRMNVGFDRNSNSAKYLFYNVYGNWVNSELAGALMVRPVFGAQKLTSAKIITKANVNIYPNPAQNILYIKNHQNIQLVEFYNINGQKIVSFNITDSYIDVSNLKTGIYLVKVILANGNSSHQKVVISR